MSEQPVIRLIPYPMAVCHPQSLMDIPQVNRKSAFYSLTNSMGHLTLICAEEDLKETSTVCEMGWRCFILDGSHFFGVTELTDRAMTTLNNSQIASISITGLRSDFILVRESHLAEATRALHQSGFSIIELV